MNSRLEPEPSVFIPSYAAHVGSFLLTSSYVGSLYLSKVMRARRQTFRVVKSSTASPAPVQTADQDVDSPKKGERDHPKVIASRLKAVCWATAFSCGSVVVCVKYTGSFTWQESLWRAAGIMGLDHFPTSVSPYVLAPILFIGPLIARYLEKAMPWQYYGYLVARRRGATLGLVEVRNYVVGPLTEELVFRSALIGLNIMGRISFWKIVFATPMWFGIAHAHHAIETFGKGGRTPQAALQAIIGALFQLTYTTLFGWYASFLFLRTGSIVPPLLAHVFCNYMGIYLPGYAIRLYPRLAIPIWTSYIFGIAAFAYGLTWL